MESYGSLGQEYLYMDDIPDGPEQNQSPLDAVPPAEPLSTISHAQSKWLFFTLTFYPRRLLTWKMLKPAIPNRQTFCARNSMKSTKDSEILL